MWNLQIPTYTMSFASCLFCTLRLVLTSTFHVALPPFCRLHSNSISRFCLLYSLWFLWIWYCFSSVIPKWVASNSHVTILSAICSSWGSEGWVSGTISTREEVQYGSGLWSWWWLSSSVCVLCFAFGHGSSVLSSSDQGIVVQFHTDLNTNQYSCYVLSSRITLCRYTAKNGEWVWLVGVSVVRGEGRISSTMQINVSGGGEALLYTLHINLLLSRSIQ